jgi:hypothetical protein
VNEIRYIQREKIDLAKWDKSVLSSDNPLLYGLSWYLDVVTNQHWAALVLDDYKAVMPLPFNRKMILLQVYRPLFIQQLGVFTKDSSSVEIDKYFQAIPKRIKKIHYPIHSAISVDPLSCSSRANLTLELKKSYEEIKQGYHKNLRQGLRKTEGQLTINETNDVSQLIRYHENILGETIGLSRQGYVLAKSLFSAILNRQMGKIYAVTDKSNAILAIALFLTGADRVINLFAVSNPKGKELFAMHFLIDQVIKKHLSTHEIFDFEGSDILGVRKFFESFGAVNSPYHIYSDDRMPGVLNRLIKLGKKIKS